VQQRRPPAIVTEPPPPLPWRLYGGFAAYIGPLIVVAWIVACAAAVALLPDFSTANQSGLLQLVPGNSPAIRAQDHEAALFGASLAQSEAVVVETDPRGLPPAVLAADVRRAVGIDSKHPAASPATQPLFAVPLVNARGLVPASGARSGTTVITYLAFSAKARSDDVINGARTYASSLPRPPGAEIAVTGAVPAQIAEGNTIEGALTLVEGVTVAVIVFLVAALYRSPVAPIVPLSGAAIAYLVSRHVIGWGAHALGLSIPSQLDPVMVVLLLGVVTDYSVFTLTGMQERLRSRERRTVAVRRTAARVVPLVIAAALTVAAGTVSLIAANVDFFHALGPGMAVAVIIAGIVAVTWVPALTGLLGRAAFWPSLRRPVTPPAVATLPGSGDPTPAAAGPTMPRGLARLLSRQGGAAIAVAVSVAAIAAAGSGLIFLRLGTDVVTALPPSSGPRHGEILAERGFAAGIVAPSTLVLQAPRIASETSELARMENAIARSPGMAGVIGPGDLPFQGLAPVFRTANGNAVRVFVVFRQDPYDGPAITALTALQAQLPTNLRSAGLGNAAASWTGATPASKDAVSASSADIWRVALLAAMLMALVLILAFRAIVAPLLLILSSAAALAAPLGLLVYVFQHLLGYPDITFYVPIVGGVLLAALGADYSVFVMGRIWENAHGRTMTEAVLTALPRAARAITIAGITLACSFAVLAVIPVQPFRELAFLIAVGAVIDAFMVRSLLLPGLLVLSGRHAFWPRRGLGAPGSRPHPVSLSGGVESAEA
jgi:RND superfamily putative drug exporter